ncbi:MAG: hypothetical protein JSU61_00570 [Fidelibacterota bacterium]|nr:MAG: hypothetical protein JSU61_00570 [Candidatus Neomarinimicrobiota bacterium]
MERSFSMRSLSRPRRGWSLALSIAVRAYLAGFFIAGCAPRRPPVSVVEARSMETRTIQADYDKVVKASINVLMDLRYTIDAADGDLGLVVASKITEGQHAELAKEPDQRREIPTWQKVLGITLIIAIIGGIIWLLTRGGGDDNGDHAGGGGDRHVYHSGGRDDYGPTVYQYKVTINVESLGPGESQVRVSGSGEQRRGDIVEQAGPIEDPEFFQRFFANLDKALFLQD